MPAESDAEKLEQDATFAHFVSKNDETASDDWARAGDIRDRLGDDLTKAAEWNEDPSGGHDSDRAREDRCRAAHLYARAAGDYLAASTMQTAAGHAAAAAALKQKAIDCAKKAVVLLERCLDWAFEQGESGRALMSDYTHLAEFYKLLDRQQDAARAEGKSKLVRELHEH